MRFKALSLLLAVLVALFVYTDVRAQESPTPTPESEQTSEMKGGEQESEEAESGEVQSEDSEIDTSRIFYKSRNTQEIINLRNLYKAQIEEYRKSEQAYIVAKTHYFNVETLVALEEAVDATELAMKNRAKVMLTYLELLYATLDETAGVELAQKETSIQQLEAMINELRIYQESIIIAEDRVAVGELADNFEPFVERYNQVSYRALSLIRIGQIQSILDVAEIIDEDIKAEKSEEEVGALTQAKRDRAYQEIQRNFEQTTAALAKINDRIVFGEQDTFSRSFYEKVLSDLVSPYSEIAQSLNHLEELLKL